MAEIKVDLYIRPDFGAVIAAFETLAAEFQNAADRLRATADATNDTPKPSTSSDDLAAPTEM